MKFVKWISLFFVDALIFFCIGFYYGMKTENFFYPGDALVKQKYESPHIIHEESKTSPVVAKEETITENTKYVVKTIIMPDKEISNEILKIPSQYIGMDRETFLAAIENFSLVPPIAEKEKGFVDATVESFSSSRVKVNMYYEEEKKGNYYVAVFDHQVVVFEADKTTIFMRTGIQMEDLPEEIQRKIITGLTLKTEEELYTFLESYSS